MNFQKNFFWLIPCIVLLIGLLPMPLGYYMLVRVIVCAACLYYASKSRKNDILLWTFGALAVLFNPIIPIYLYNKAIWFFINIGTDAILNLNKNLVEQD